MQTTYASDQYKRSTLNEELTMSQFTNWDNTKLIVEAHHRDLHQLTNSQRPADKPLQQDTSSRHAQRTKLSVVLAVIVAVSKR
jgi:hypothetical protein